MLTAYTGRPADESGRLETERRVYDLLDALHIEYRRLDHAPAMTMDVDAEIDAALDAMICKNLFLCNRKKTKFYLLMLPGNKSFDAKEFSAQLGAPRLSFADAAHMERLLGLRPGAVSVMGLMNDTENRVQLVIDRAVLRGEYLGCHPCVNTSSIRFSMTDFLHTLLPAMHHEPEFVELSEA